jgi:hypothetical protein
VKNLPPQENSIESDPLIVDQILRALKSMKLEYVELVPGETLLVPSGYSVLSEPSSLSVTIDVLTASKEQILFMEAIMTPLPLERYSDLHRSDKKAKTLPLQQEERIIFTQVHTMTNLHKLFSKIFKYVLHI